MASYGEQGATGTRYAGYTTYPANGDQVRFAFTYIHPCKTNMFGFSPSVHGKFWKTQKKTWYIVPCLPEVVPFPMPYLISLKVPAFSQYSTCWDTGYRCLMEGKKIREGGLGCYQPLVTKIPPYMVQNLYSERDLFIKLLLGEKNKKKLTYDHFRPTHTYIKLTFVSLLLLLNFPQPVMDD